MEGIYNGYIIRYFAEGEAQGLKKGEARGLKKGEKENTVKLLNRKLDKGKSFEQACSELELTEEEIEEIRPVFTR